MVKTIGLFQKTAILAIGSAVLLTPLVSEALTIEEVTNPKSTGNGWVTDMADILSDKTEIELNRLITNLEKNNGVEITVVTVPETAPAASPKVFATELFNYWGIGKAELDNGVLFLISEADNRVEIETGYGISKKLSNDRLTKIIDRTILPQYRQGNLDRGTLEGTQAIVKILNPKVAKDSNFIRNFIFQYFIALLLSGIWAIAKRRRAAYRKKHYKVFVRPNQYFSLSKGDERTVCCKQCCQPMKRFWESLQLTKPQKVAQKLGTVEYLGYLCSNCKVEGRPYSILAYCTNSDRYDPCPRCQELTMSKTSQVKPYPQSDRPDELIVKKHCHCCGLEQESIQLLSFKRPPRTKDSHRRNRYRVSVSGDYSGSSCSGSSGADFGGGASGGDGAGDSW